MYKHQRHNSKHLHFTKSIDIHCSAVLRMHPGTPSKNANLMTKKRHVMIDYEASKM